MDTVSAAPAGTIFRVSDLDRESTFRNCDVRCDPSPRKDLKGYCLVTAFLISNPDPVDRETVYSYLSRLAATWRTDVPDFAHDIGAPFKAFIEQNPSAFAALTDWAGLDAQQMEEMLSWTGVRAGNVRMRFRGELVLSRAVRNPVVRGCPICLREDALQHDGPSTAAMVMRGDWQFREVNVCVRHSHPLVPLWKSENPRDRNNIGAHLRPIEQDILSGRLDQKESTPSEYDRWLDRRLRTGSDETWLTSQPLYAVTSFIRLLGQAVAKNRDRDISHFKGAFHNAGFEIARKGEAAIRQAFDRLAQGATGHLDEPQKTFGLLYPALNSDSLEDRDFDSFRKILRECVLENWPVSPGNVLMGELVTERRLHSVVTAAKEIGVTAELLEHHLIDVGAISEFDHRPRSRKLFVAPTFADLLIEIPNLVGSRTLLSAMGATDHEFDGLVKEGLLTPFTNSSKVQQPWRLSDGIRLVEELRAKASTFASCGDDWETLLRSRRRTGISLAILIEMIRDNRLRVALSSGIIGFHGIVVSKTEVDSLIKAAPQKPQEAKLPGEMSAAEFGRLVGLRDDGQFIALVKAGHTPAEKHIHPRTGHSQFRVSAEDIEAFHRRFVTVSTLSKELGRHRNTVRGLLSSSGLSRFSPNGHDFGAVYLRSEVALVLT